MHAEILDSNKVCIKVSRAKGYRYDTLMMLESFVQTIIIKMCRIGWKVKNAHVHKVV